MLCIIFSIFTMQITKLNIVVNMNCVLCMCEKCFGSIELIQSIVG